MDGLHQYEITLKKDGLFINLSSDDVYFISKQMDKWFRILLDDSYVPVSLPQRPAYQTSAQPELQPAPPAPVYAEAAPQQPIYAAPQEPVAQPQPVQPQAPLPQVQPMPEPVYQAPVAPQPLPQAPEPQPQYQPQFQQPAAVQPVYAPPAMAQPEPAPVYAPSYADVQLPQAQPQPVQYAAPVQPQLQPQPQFQQQPVAPVQPQPAMAGGMMVPGLDESVQDDFEAVMDSLMKDFDEPEQSAPAMAPMMPAGNGNGNGHAATYQPAVMAQPVMSESLSDLCERSNAGSSEDYLLLSAYFLTQVERVGQFSLKRVNSTLVKSGLTPINHSVLETTLSRGYLSMVPDLTGMADVTEYVLTADGQQAAANLL